MKHIVFLSDFGLNDPYVAQVKGAVACINPHASIIDLTHAIEPHNILQAAFILGSSYRYFPDNSIFLSVVDPGVGSGRRCLVMQAGKQFFIAPDNGLLTIPFMDYRKNAKCHAIENPDCCREGISSTFHGRDIMGPAAAWLALGKPPEACGPEIDDPELLDIPTPEIRDMEIRGVILYYDRFGNAITNIRSEMVKNMTASEPDTRKAFARAADMAFPFEKTYSSTEPGSPLALYGSAGYIELAINQGSLLALLKGEKAGKPSVTITVR